MEEREEKFEGVRADVGNGFFCLIKSCKGTSIIEVEMDGDEEFSFEEKFYKEIARRWNAYPTLKSEINSLADKIVELEKSSNNYLDKLGDSNGKLLLACSNLSDKDAEITRLKEENERLKGDVQTWTRISSETTSENSAVINIVKVLEDENCSLRERVNTVEDLQSQLSQAKERIRELETPRVIQPAGFAYGVILPDACEWFNKYDDVDAFLEAQAALKEGE